MQKHFYFSILILLSLFCTQSYALKWSIRGESYQVDTLFYNQIGPGTTQTSLILTGPSKLRVFYMTTDLKNPYVKLRAVMAKDKIYAAQPVSIMAKEHTTPQVSYFAGINADFFNMEGTKEPLGTTVIDGEYYCNNNTNWQAFVLDDNNVPYLATTPKMTCTIEGRTFSMNTSRSNNSLVLYSQRFGETTGTDNRGSEVVVYLTNGDKLMAGRTVMLTVDGTPISNKGNSMIPKNKFILSGQGTMASFVKSLTQGKQLKMTITSTMDGMNVNNVMQCLGGSPLIVSNGQVLNTDVTADHLIVNNPRTAIGFNRDKTKIIMLIVDGRSSISAGVISKALADIMIQLGCTKAMNFDGGGSSTIYTKDFGVVNNPSAGSERYVANGLYLTTNVPTDNAVTSVRFAELKKTVPQFTSYTPIFYAYNRYGVLISKEFKGVQLSCSSEVGKIINNGTSFLCTGTGTYTITATYQGHTTTIPITAITSKPSIYFRKIFDDGYRGYKVNISVRANQKIYSAYNECFNWKSNDNSIATVDSTGIIKGINNGKTLIYISNKDFKDTLCVTVQKPTIHNSKIDTTFNVSTLKMSTIALNNSEMHSNNNELTFSGTALATSSSSILISKTATLWSIPDSIKISFNPENTPINSITFCGLSDKKNFSANAPVISLKPNETNSISIPLSHWCDISDRSVFPISISSIRFYLGNTNLNTKYEIKVSSLEAIYDSIPHHNTSIEQNNNDQLFYPIIKNDQLSVLVPLEQRINLNLYNLSGQLLLSKFDLKSQDSLPIENLQKGIYIIKISNTSFSKLFKIIIR